MAQRFKSKISEVCRQHLGAQTQQNKKFRPQPLKQKSGLSPEALKLEVEVVKDYKENLILGHHETHVALKNPDSFLIGTCLKGLILIKNDVQLYSGELPKAENQLSDIAYFPPLNCYFYAMKTKLYRKDNNDRPPYFFMDIQCGGRAGACLRYSKATQRLIISKDGKSFSVLNPKTKKLELVMTPDFADYIMDFKLFRGQNNRVVSLTMNGHITLYSQDYKGERGVVSHFEEQLIEHRSEFCSSIAVDQKGEYVFIEVSGYRSRAWISSRIVILKLTGNTFTKRDQFDHYSESSGFGYALDFFGYVGKQVLWIRLSFDGTALVYGYDSKAEEVKELLDKRVAHLELKPWRLLRVGDKLYYTGSKGKLMSLSMKS